MSQYLVPVSTDVGGEASDTDHATAQPVHANAQRHEKKNPTRKSVRTDLLTNLQRSHHRQRPLASPRAAQPELSDEEAREQLPASRETLLQAANDVLAVFRVSQFKQSECEVGETGAIVEHIIRCYRDPERMVKLREAQDDVPTRANSFRIAIIATGGTPHELYGTGTDLDACKKALRAAQESHNLFLDVVPLFIRDFEHSIVRMAVSVATVLLVKLRADEESPFRWGRRVDAIMFGSKGTAAAALATHAFYMSRRCTSPLHLIGFGTDLSQGFFDINGSGLPEHVRILVLNSVQDDSIDERARAKMIKLLKPNRNRNEHLYNMHDYPDVLDDDGYTPRHTWYTQAFKCKRVTLAEDILSRIARFHSEKPLLTATGQYRVVFNASLV